MEKTINFSVFKEKIIKTNELLSVLLEKNKTLEKTQKWSKQLKLKLELSKNEINKLKLRNETLIYDLKSVGKNYESVKSDYKKLQSQFTTLENESSKTINNLQVNYQLTNQELSECKRTVSTLEKKLKNQRSKSPVKINKKVPKNKKSPVRRKESVSEPNDDVGITTAITAKLQSEKEKLCNEKSDLQFENHELRKQIASLKNLQDDLELLHKTEDKLKNREVELVELKNKFQSTVDSKIKEIEQLLKEMKNIKIKNDKLQAENEKLKHENCSYKVEISMLQEQDCWKREEVINTVKKNHSLTTETGSKLNGVINMNDVKNSARDDSKTPTNDEISEIMKQMIIPAKLSPFSDLEETIRYDDPSLPPLEENIINENPPSPPPTAMLNKPKTPRSSSLRILEKRRNLINRRKLAFKKKTKRVDLLGALLALKKANINFIITSDSLVQSERVSPRYVTMPNPIRSKVKPIDKRVSNTLTCELNCSLTCKKSYMLLKDSDDENAPLLGFFDVKNELNNQKASAVKNIEHNFLVPKPLLFYRSTKKRKKLNKPNEDARNKAIRRCEIAQKDNSVDVCYINTEEETCSTERLADASRNKQRENCNDEDTTNKANRRSDNRSSSIDDVLENREDVCYINTEAESCSRKQSQDFSTYKNRNISETEPPAETETEIVSEICDSRKDEATTPLVKEIRCDKVQVRRSKRKTSLLSVIKKKQLGRGNTLKTSKSNFTVFDGVSPIHVEEKKIGTSIKEAIGSITTQSKAVGETTKKLHELVPKLQETAPQMPVLKAKSPKTVFKRPVCSTRRSARLEIMKTNFDASDVGEHVEEEKLEESLEENLPLESPQSPPPSNEQCVVSAKPVLIPLEKASETVEKMPTSKIEMLFNKLIVYSAEEEALNEVVREFSAQEPEYIAEAILERIAVDYHVAPDTKYSPAPLMTDVQRTMLGFMSKLEKQNVIGVFDSFLTLAERRLITCDQLQQFGPITRLYLAICKLKKNLSRMRRLCCDVCYFCGDFAVPFLFIVLTSWTEVLPHEANSEGMPLARVLVQIVYMKDCNKPGYNLMPLRDLLHKFYGYPTERWDENGFFKELYEGYLKKPVKSSDYAILLYCKNRPEKWVYERIEEYFKAMLSENLQENFKAAVIILIGNLYTRFSSKSEVNYLPRIREWFLSLLTETTSDLVKRSVHLCLKRLPNK